MAQTQQENNVDRPNAETRYIYYRVEVSLALLPAFFQVNGPVQCTCGIPHGSECVVAYQRSDINLGPVLRIVFRRALPPGEVCLQDGRSVGNPIDIEPLYEQVEGHGTW